MKKKFMLIVILILACAMLLTGCIPGDGRASTARPANFLWGIWHGWLAPLSLIISIFNPSITIYEVHNTGWWYDFGYYMAVISGFGTLALSRGKKKKD